MHRLALYLTLSCVISLVCQAAHAGKYNPVLNVGDAAPEWRDLPGVDDQKHSLAQYADYESLVIVFTCNTCPTATDYEPRLQTLAAKFVGGKQCAVIAINANQVADDLLPKMKERAERLKFNYVYLHDDTQQIARAYGATVTPEFFVLDKQRKVVYMGAMDDATDAAAVKVKYVEDAIAATLAGKQPAVTETVGRGCLVRFVRERRKK
ncbi:MAG: redoxin domain-containing protein [Pirellulales bacterium]